MDQDAAPKAEEKFGTEGWMTTKAWCAKKVQLPLWEGDFVTFLGNRANHDDAKQVKEQLNSFGANPTPRLFKEFMNTLRDFAYVNSERVWMIVDEATKYDGRFAIPWPSEQDKDVFHFVLTGSKFIASFVGQRSLGK